MQVISVFFVLFFLIVFFLFYSVKQKSKLILLLSASAFFVYFISPQALIFCSVSTVINFFLALLIKNDRFKNFKRSLFYSGMIWNIGSLIFYKYTNFLLEYLNLGLNLFTSADLELPLMSILTPLGISFYTFQAIGYLYRIFKSDELPERNFVIFGIYMMYFPKFVAGPIERHKAFMSQLKSDLTFNYENITEGFRLIIWGLIKKVVIADTLSRIVFSVYGDVTEYHGLSLILILIIQPIHIYCDFSGYTDSARGISKMLGLNLIDNFNRPFFSTNVTTFWKRWHISLSSWCNDFIYKRLILKHLKWGNLASSYAVFVTFFVVGIWHGANFTFVIVGILQAIAINFEFFTKRRRLAIGAKLPPALNVWISRALTYLFFSFSLIFFNAESTKDAFHFITNLFTDISLQKGSLKLHIDREETFFAGLAFMVVFIAEYFQESNFNIKLWFFEKRIWFKWVFYILLGFVLMYFSKNQNHFVYMQF